MLTPNSKMLIFFAPASPQFPRTVLRVTGQWQQQRSSSPRPSWPSQPISSRRRRRCSREKVDGVA